MMEYTVTPETQLILWLLSQGDSWPTISAKLFTSITCCKGKVRRFRDHHKLLTTTQAVAYALRTGVIE